MWDVGGKHGEYFKPPSCSVICMSDISKADPAPCFTWLGGSPANEPLPCKVRLAGEDSCHRNGGKPFLVFFFLKGRLDSVENIKNYGAACEFPLAPSHDMQKIIIIKKRN